MKTGKLLQIVKTDLSRGLVMFSLFLLAFAHPARAQTTEFTYQGRLAETSLSANYDFEFRLFDAEAGGTLLGTLSRPNILAVSGLYSVNLDFGANFPGDERWLEISVRPAGSPDPYETLSPRLLVTSAPYAIRSLTAGTAVNALRLGGLSANQYVLTGDARLSDARFPLPGSNDYIQNTTSLQRANFNISGNGTLGGTLSANVVTAALRYDLGGERVLSTGGTQNLFVGINAGETNPVGGSNTFVGFQAGSNIAAGNNNSFFGRSAGLSATTGIDNSFFGSGTGIQHSTGNFDSFFGRRSGENNTTGSANSFFGYKSGAANTTGSNNTMLGASADLGAGNLQFATAVGANSIVTTSNTIALGRSNGSDTVQVFGLGSSGNTSLCRNAANRISTCSSSLRYKTGVQPFTGGLGVINRLRPIRFVWREGGMLDVGFAAEEVERIEPLLVTYNQKGEIEGVKYSQMTVVLVNAVREQQVEIEEQKKQLQEQREQIEALKKLICLSNQQAEICQEK